MVATTAVATAAAKKTQHTSWVQTGLYLSYEIVFPNLHPQYDPAPVFNLATSLIPRQSMSVVSVKKGTPLGPKLASSQGLIPDL